MHSTLAERKCGDGSEVIALRLAFPTDCNICRAKKTEGTDTALSTA
jgi:hypothetical protein